MVQTGSTTMSTGSDTFLGSYQALNKLLYVRFVNRDMLLHYHWGHGVGHVYSHVSQTEADSGYNHASTSPNTRSWGDSKSNVDSGDQASASDASDDWEDSDNDSNHTGPDNSTDHSEGLESDLESEEEVLIASYLESIHPAIDVLEYDGYRY